MSTPSLLTLLLQQTKVEIYDFALGIARAIGLPVDSWQAGDPTRSLYHIESEMFEKLEGDAVGSISSHFLDYATGDWLKIGAKQRFNVDVPEATFASTAVVLTNTGAGFYVIEAGDLTFKNSTTDKTYRNTSGGTLASGNTLTVSVVADEAGSASSAAAGEIDDLVTVLAGVTCTNPAVALGTDGWDDQTIRAQCRAKIGSFSPDGPPTVYEYVARNADLTGTNAITRVRVFPTSSTGRVQVYLAGPGGAVAEVDRALVEAAILKWATPLTITPTVSSATPVTIGVTYELWLYKSVGKTVAEIRDEVQTALATLMLARPIGGDVITSGASGKIYQSMIESVIRGVFSQAFRVSVTTPSGDTTLTAGQVPVLGTVTGTINLVNDP